MTVVSLDRFRQYLPPLPEGKTSEAVLKKLRTAAKNLITRQSRWRGFLVDPAESTKEKDDTLERIEHVYEGILRAGGMHTPKLKFTINDADDAAPPEPANKDRLPNVYLASSSDEKSPWCSVAVCGAYRKTHSEQNEAEVSVVRCIEPPALT